MGWARNAAVLLATAIAIVAAVLAGCDDGSGAQPAPPGDGEPAGLLVYLVDHANPPLCPDPCHDEDPPAGGSKQWLELVPASGGEPRRIGCVWEHPRRCQEGEPPPGRWGPVFSPRGGLIATVDTIDVPSAKPGEVLIHDLDGKVVGRVTAPGNTDAAAWSPDERYLAVATDWPPGDALYMVDRRRNRHRLISRDAGAVKWSARNLMATRTLTVMRPDGRVVHRFGHKNGSVYDWSPSGKTIAFACRKAICAARYDGKARRVLTRRCHPGTGSLLAWSPDGDWIACSRGGDLVAVRLHDGAVRVIRAGHPDESVYDVDWGK